MSDENPQEQQTVGPTGPKEPGEIGWPANWDAPGDPSTPEPGAGAPHGGYDVDADRSPLPQPEVPADEAEPVAHEVQPGEIGWAADADAPHPDDTTVESEWEGKPEANQEPAAE